MKKNVILFLLFFCISLQAKTILIQNPFAPVPNITDANFLLSVNPAGNGFVFIPRTDLNNSQTDVNNASYLGGIPSSGYIRTDGQSTTTNEIPFSEGIRIPEFKRLTIGGTTLQDIGDGNLQYHSSGAFDFDTNFVTFLDGGKAQDAPVIVRKVQRDTGLGFSKDSAVLYSKGIGVLTINTAGSIIAANFIPSATNTWDLGSALIFFKTVYTANISDGITTTAINSIITNATTQTISGAKTFSNAAGIIISSIKPILSLTDTSTGNAKDYQVIADNNNFYVRQVAPDENVLLIDNNGNISFNQVYGDMNMDEGSTSVTIAATNTYYGIPSGLGSSLVGNNGFTMGDANRLIAQAPGTYLINYSTSFNPASASNVNLSTCILKNDFCQRNTTSHKLAGLGANANVVTSGTGIISLVPGDRITIGYANHTSATNVTVEHVNFTAVRISN